MINARGPLEISKKKKKVSFLDTLTGFSEQFISTPIKGSFKG